MRTALIRSLSGSHTLRKHSAFRTRALHRFTMQLPQSPEYVLAPELTWTGEAFERDVHVSVGADGLIQSVRRSADVDSNAAVHRLPGRALLPGMVNAHSHAFQRGLRGLGETYPKNSAQSSFWTWREEMYKLVGGMSEKQIYDLTRQCFSEMRDAGITSVGEFHYFHHGRPGEGKNGHEFAYDETVLRAAKDVGIRIVLLNAYYEHGGFQRAPMVESQKRFKVDSHDVYWNQMDALQMMLKDAPTQSIGVVAHSMRAVEVPDIVKLHEESVRRGLVFHIHLEEQTKEVDDCKAAHNGETPMGLLLKNLKIDEKFTAVHCTWTEADELKQFVEKKGNVCICPLTEGNLGDGFPFIASCSDRVCLGTDCNARVDMCEEMRWLEYAHRLHESRRGVCTDATSETDLAKLLFRYGTKNGAESLNLHVGEIKEGYAADFALVDIEAEQLKFSTPSSLMGSFIFGANGSSVVKATSVNGKWRERVVKVQEAPVKSAESGVSDERKAQIEAAAALSDANSDDVVKLAIGLNSIKVAPQDDAAVKADRYNVYASRSDSKTPRLLFNSHMDTVPPYLPPRIDSTTLYGRGACDAKSLIAGQMIAAQKLVDAGLGDDVQVLFVVSEETDHSGMKKANELNVNPAHMIVGEPTALKMSKMQKGVLKIQLTQDGVAAHSGYPHLGDSAIDPMIDVLYDLKKESWPTTEQYGNTDLNIGLMNGGQAANALAEKSSAMLMFRLVTEPDVIYKRVEEIVAGRVSMKLYSANAPVHLTTVEGYDTGVACFNTDVPYFNFDGKAYLVGAGSITDAHCPREFIMLDDLKSLVDYYFTLGKRLIEVGK
ncbi:Formiminoglutamate deiminase [Phytophthora megakarya]|uniref:Formiminoglutamate deiminase n=1 Tax=Phytophthora megakarya TaxID=4795 RepID=A0A225W002_9STRA|nr:Formiminoglutamate deiminase [Phytophthora megakarya]